MYLPAYDSPATQKGLSEYSGKAAKKFLRESKLSADVEISVYWNLGSVLTEYPTPAGDYKNKRWESLCQE